MTISSYLKHNRQLIERDLLNSPKRMYFSPAFYAQYKITIPLIIKYCNGMLLDAGCGNMPYKKEILNHVSTYIGLDYEPHLIPIDITADIQDMKSILSQTFDTVICLEVLEHVPQPDKALAEIYRILKPKGYAIISVPHLSRLHDIPHDYFRFTSYGMSYILEKNGLKVIEMKRRGGIFSFLGHQVSTFLHTLTWRIPLINSLIFVLNGIFLTLFGFYLDKITKSDRLFPVGYSIVVQKEILE